MAGKWKQMTRIVTLLLAAVAVAGPLRNGGLVALPAPGVVRIDGRLDEWNRSAEILAADALPVPGRAARAVAMYDSECLYLALQVYDPTPLGNLVDPVADPGRGWLGDCVQVRLAMAADNPERCRLVHVDCYWYTVGSRPAAYLVRGRLGADGGQRETVEDAIGAGMRAGFGLTANGYFQEMALPWTLLGRPAGPLGKCRLSIEPSWAATNRYQPAGDRLAMLLNPAFPVAGYLWENPAAWGTLTFAETGEAAPSLRYLPLVEAALPAAAEVRVPGPVCRTFRPESALVNAWFEAGTAAGLAGVTYDNRDGGHSPLDLGAFPQVSAVTYSQAEQEADEHMGAATRVRPGIVIGNSSTSDRPTAGGSNVRRYYVSPDGMTLLHRQYRGNNVHVYPEHCDYDPGHNGPLGYGDLLPANSPYVLTSQGSSGSDQAFLHAFAHALAALPPRLRAELAERGWLMPTLQALFRQTRTVIREPADYFTGLAHPPVFAGESIDAVGFIRAAHDLCPASVPPLVRLAVVADVRPEEVLATTPQAVARSHRRRDRWLELEISAAGSEDWGGRSLQYHWVLLQGKPERVRIEPTDEGARLAVAWHGRFPVASGAAMETNRVDIGVFAGNGDAWSAPAFVTVYYPDDERRRYDPEDRLVEFCWPAIDPTIGAPTDLVLSAPGWPKYDIADWPALLRLAAPGDDAPGARLLRAELSLPERRFLGVVAERLEVSLAEYALLAARVTASPSLRDRNKYLLHRDLTVTAAAPLLTPDPTLGRSAKAILEDALNRLVYGGPLTVPGAPDPPATADCPSQRTAVRNLRILREQLFPGIVTTEPRLNTVDERRVQDISVG